MSLVMCPHNKRANGTKARKTEQTMGSDMFFLLRTAFWLTLVLVLIPLGSDQEDTSTENIDPVSAFLAAQATMSDIGGFCGRNPQACETGGDALTAIGSRARDGARIVYEFLDTQIAEKSGSEQLVTGSTPVPSAGTTSGQPSGQEPQVFAGTPSCSRSLITSLPKRQCLGRCHGPNHAQAKRPEHTGRSRSYDLLDLKTADCAPAGALLHGSNAKTASLQRIVPLRRRWKAAHFICGVSLFSPLSRTCRHLHFAAHELYEGGQDLQRPVP